MPKDGSECSPPVSHTINIIALLLALVENEIITIDEFEHYQSVARSTMEEDENEAT